METVSAHPQKVDVEDLAALDEESTLHVKADAMAGTEAVVVIEEITSRDVQAMVVTDLAIQIEVTETTTLEIGEAGATTAAREEDMVVDGHNRTTHSSRTK